MAGLTKTTSQSSCSSRPDSRISITSSVDYEKHCGLPTPRSPQGSRSSSPDFSCSSSPPNYIILALWPNARSEQIQHYVEGYASLYPHSKPLLLHHTYFGHNTPNNVSVLDALLEDCEKLSYHDESPIDDQILIHLFGDAAATNTCSLLKAYRARTNLKLGVKALVFDSVPVIVAPSLRSLRSKPSTICLFLFYSLYAFFSQILSTLTSWLSDPFSTRVRQDLYDPTLLCQDARKCYIFAERDVMFAWDRKTTRGEEGENEDSGYLKVTHSVRRKSVDCEERWTGDQERYWLGVENAWEGR